MEMAWRRWGLSVGLSDWECGDGTSPLTAIALISLQLLRLLAPALSR